MHSLVSYSDRASSPPILICSHFRSNALPLQETTPFRQYVSSGRIRELWEWDITEEDFATTAGVITTIHLDQNRAMTWKPYFSQLLSRGGRIVLNGHVVRPFIDGLSTYQPLSVRGKTDLALTVLADHPIFSGIDRISCGSRRGVAGFYGRGHNPMPEGGVALTGVGPDLAPLDWAWKHPSGGAVFSHAGNDLWGVAEEDCTTDRLIANMVDWASFNI